MAVFRELAIVSGEGDDGVVRALEPFDAFYRRERRSMVALAHAASGSRLAAEDLTQDAFVAAYREWERVGRLDNPATWVRRVVINQSVSGVRRRVSETRALMRMAVRADRHVLPAAGHDLELVLAVVRRLPKRQRQVIALRYVGGFSMADIAEVLECSKESVNTHLRRARVTVARRLRLDEEDP